MKNAITKRYRMLVIAILAVGCAGLEPAAQFSVKGVAVVLATPGAAIPSSTTTAMLTATKVGTPASGGTMRLSLGELKYRLLEKYPDFFFCDSDKYPVYRIKLEQERAIARFPEIQRDTETYQAILKHTKLEGLADLSNNQKLTVYREFKKLDALIVEPSGEVYRFRLRVPSRMLTDYYYNGLIIEGTITETGEITVSKREPTNLQCPR